MNYEKSLEFAKNLDQSDEIHFLRDFFHIPLKNNKPIIYFCGNSLGLQPKNIEKSIDIYLKKWKNQGVEGHFTNPNAWVNFHYKGKEILAKLIGAKKNEVLMMNSLTTNLHLLLSSFYQPKGSKKKIIIEKGSFPSDYFAISSQMKMKGINPSEHLIEIEPNDDEIYETKSFLKEIEKWGDQLTLVFLSGVQYYNGQFFDIKKIAEATRNVNAVFGLDLAHAIGNVPLHLNEYNVDFAVWCSYKYLNSGPGNIGGLFINEKHGLNLETPRLEGWWGHDEKTRFEMKNNFSPMKGVDGWMLSNVNIIAATTHLFALELFNKVDFSLLRKKSIKLTGFLEFLILNTIELKKTIKILTPSNIEERGCQLSLYISQKGKEIYDYLKKNNVIVDWREPNVIRVAPTPLYNKFEEVYNFVDILKKAIKNE